MKAPRDDKNEKDRAGACPTLWCGFSFAEKTGRYVVQSPAMSTLASVLNQLEQERIRLAARLHGLTEAISALTGLSENRSGRISSAGRARIAAAQRARWANAKGQRGVSSARRKRTLSAAAIARIRTAQKQRWAKWRKQQKAA